MFIQNIESGFSKYLPYLNIKHEWHGINCFTLIDDIYNKFLGLDFLKTYERANIDNAYQNKFWWYGKFNKDFFEKERLYWTKIELIDLNEYDLLIFYVKRKHIGHFGLYIEQNKFIHIEENSYCSFQILDDEWRNNLYGAFRHEKLV